MSGSHSGYDDVDIDLGGLVRAIWRRRARVLFATLLGAGLAFAAASLISPQYRSETRLLIESRQPAFSGATQTQAPIVDGTFDDSAIASQVQVLRSIDLIKQVARDMKLYELEEFDPTAKPSAFSDILVMFGVRKNPLEMPPEERVLKEFQEKLQVYQVEKSRVIAIQFTSKDARLAAAIPNAMANVYLSMQSGAKLDSNSEASRWLEPEIANLREKVRDAEAKVADYRSSSDLLSTGDAGGTFATKQLNDISTELSRVRGERANAEARAEGVRTTLASGRDADTLNDVVGSQMIQRLKESESVIQSQIADLSTSLLDGHPRLKGLKSQLQGIRTQIRAETQKILSSLKNEADVARLREQQLTQQLNTLKATSAKAGEDEVGLRALEREATAQRQLLETYLSRYREATSRTGGNATPADARVISSAVEPTEAYFPKILPITLVAALAVFLISCAVIMLGELFSGRGLRPVESGTFLDPGDVALRQAEPASAVTPAADVAFTRDTPPVEVKNVFAFPEHDIRKDDVPLPETASPDIATTGLETVQPVTAKADERTPVPVETDSMDRDDDYTLDNVAVHLVDVDARLVVCVSPAGDEGSTGTVMLARLLAEGGRKIVLIDLTESACPTLLMASSAGLPGITDLLAEEHMPFTDTIHPDRMSEAHLIPQGVADPVIAMRGIDRLQMIIDALSNAYDTVLVECGAAGAQAVRRLTQSTEAKIIISASAAEDDDIVGLIEDFGVAGFDEIVLMTGASQPQSGRKRAA